jgi:cation transport ATPase
MLLHTSSPSQTLNNYQKTYSLETRGVRWGRTSALTRVSFEQSCRATGEEDRRAELANWRRSFLTSAALTLPVFLFAMVLPVVPGARAVLKAPIGGFMLEEVVKWMFTTPIQFWIGWRFHAGAFRALRSGRWGPCDVLSSASPLERCRAAKVAALCSVCGF